MRRLLTALVLSAFAATASAQAAAPPAAWEDAVRARRIEKSTLSPFCPGKTLYDCPSPAAAEWRADIQRWVREGRSAAQIRAELQARRPEFDLEGASGAGPVGALVAAFTLALLLALGWRLRRGGADDVSGEAAPGPPLEDEEERALDRSLEQALDGELARFDEA